MAANKEQELAEARETMQTLRAELAAAHQELQKTNSELLQLTLHLDSLVEERTEALRKSEEHNREIVESMHRLQRERSMNLEKLAVSVAHQIRNPITAIGGFANMLLKPESSSETASARVQVILEEVEKLEQMVKAVAAYAELGPTKRVKVSGTALLRTARERLELEAAATGRTVEWKEDCEGELWANADILLDALRAILVNSLEFNPGPVVPIRVGAGLEGGSWRLAVSDRGNGIAAEDLPYIFDPFFTTKAKGVGMGLCLAQRIIIEHQGKLEVKSVPGRGTDVFVTLPQRQREEGKVPVPRIGRPRPR